MGALVLSSLQSLPGLITAISSIASQAVWRPPQWSNRTQQPPLEMMANDPVTGQPTVYVFDTIIKAEHHQQCVVTLNPVQTGASITDNAYVVPPTLTVEIAMSDAMQSYTLGQWANAPSKSVSAFQTLVGIQGSLTPVQLSTRLRSYSNMMITDVRVEDEARTKYGLRAWVTFQQILTASVAITNVSSTANQNTLSAIPQTTGSTNSGQINPLPVPDSMSDAEQHFEYGRFSGVSQQLVPLSSLPNQVLSVTLSLNGGTLTVGIKQYFNRIGGFWCIDIYSSSGTLLIASVPLITGSWPGGNILAPIDYLQIGQAFVINQNGASTDFPTSTNLGSGFTLLWTDNDGSGTAPGYPTVPPVAGSGNWSSYNVAGLATVLG